jgi:dipeptidyl aminopeptidase/acylaminoacyl peptidase
MTKNVFLIGFVCWFQTILISQTETPNSLLTIETLWKMGRLQEAVVSPDGNMLIFSLKKFNWQKNKGNSDIYRIPISGGIPVKLTVFQGDEYNIKIRPDGKKIGFLSAESGEPQLWEMNLDGTDLSQTSQVDGGISNFNYSPSLKNVYYSKDVDITPVLAKSRHPDLGSSTGKVYDAVMIRHWTSWEDGAYSHIFKADYPGFGNETDLMPKEAYDSPLSPMGGEEQLNWSPNGRYIAYTCKKIAGGRMALSTNADIYVYDLNSGKTTNISSPNPGYDIEPRFSPDGKMVAWLSMQRDGYEADRNRIMVSSISENGFSTPRELTVGFDYTLENLYWDGDSKTIYFQCTINATDQIYSISATGGKPKQITKGQHNLNIFGVAGKKLVCGRTTHTNPQDVYLIDLLQPESKNLSPLFEPNKEIISSLKMPKSTQRMVKTTDGKDMLVWVITPPDFDPKKKYPTILYCQGGPQSAVNQFYSYRWNFALMASKGYVVVAPNRRGLPGFGTVWNEQISGDYGGQAMSDMLSAIDDVSKEPWVDKDRRAAVGASFGGYTVYWLAGNHQKRFKSFVSHCGLFNLPGFYGATEELFFADFDFKGPYWENPNNPTYTKFSPHLFVKNWDTPIFVIHTEKDFRVPITEGIQAYSAAQVKKIPSRFMCFSDEGHWVTKPHNSIFWQREFYGWLEETLK